MATPALRPLGIGEILDAAIKLYTRHFWVLAACVLVFAVPLEIADVGVRAAIDPDTLKLGSGPSADRVLNGPGVVTALLQGLTLVLGQVVCCVAVSEAWLGRRPQVDASLRAGLARTLPALGLAVVLWVALFAALVALILPAIWLAVAFSLSWPVLVLERRSPLAALGRSYALVGGRWWATFSTYLLTIVLAFVLLLLVGLLLGLFARLPNPDSVAAGAVANAVVGAIVNAVVIPWFAAVTVTLYYDRRGATPVPGTWQPPVAESPAWPLRPAPSAPAGEPVRWRPPEPPVGG